MRLLAATSAAPRCWRNAGRNGQAGAGDAQHAEKTAALVRIPLVAEALPIGRGGGDVLAG